MNNFEELAKKAREMSDMLDVSMKEFENILNIDHSSLNEEQSIAMNNAKRITTQALDLAKKGDVVGINDLINTFKNASKNN